MPSPRWVSARAESRKRCTTTNCANSADIDDAIRPTPVNWEASLWSACSTSMK